MKAQKKLNVVLIILIIILISIISFVGIFYQNKNKMSNYVKDYSLGTDLEGYRKIILLVDEDNEENTDELKNYDNYVKSADIIRNRLDSMNITDYSVECNESTGQIEIRLPENSQTDYILADITQKGSSSGFITNPISIFQIWYGGLGIMGGAILGIIGGVSVMLIYKYALKRKPFVYMNYLYCADFIIPAILAIGVSGFKLYKSIVKDKAKENIKLEIIRHTVFSGIMLLVMILSSLVEVFICTNILKGIIKYF